MTARAEFFCVCLGGIASEGFFGHFYFWQFFKNPDEVFPWINFSAAAALDEGIPDGVALSGGFAAHEEPVLCAEFGGAYAVFDKVIINLQSPILEAEFELRPLP